MRSIRTFENTRVPRKFVQLRINDLFSFLEYLNQVVGLVSVTRREECISRAGALRTSGSSDTMDVVLGVGRVVQINHKFDVLDIWGETYIRSVQRGMIT